MTLLGFLLLALNIDVSILHQDLLSRNIYNLIYLYKVYYRREQSRLLVGTRAVVLREGREPVSFIFYWFLRFFITYYMKYCVIFFACYAITPIT